jgi:hypothetical protein
MARDPRQGSGSEFRIAKHFDTTTYPDRLQPLRGMAAHTNSNGLGIGNIIVNENGLMYGLGLDTPSNPTNGELYKSQGYGSGDDFVAGSTAQLSGAVLRSNDYNFLVDWPDAGNVRTIHWASTNLLIASKPDADISATTNALTFSFIGQGLVHPKDKNLYYPYLVSSTGASYIGLVQPDATPFNTETPQAFQLPDQYLAWCLSSWGDYLAVPMTARLATSLVNSNIVGLWDRDTSITTFAETIHWGQGVLKVLNNVNNVLIGVSELGSDSLQAGTTQDYNAIQVKVYNGGYEPTVVGEIRAHALSGASGQPSVSINHRVNFVQNNRLYFSAKVDPNDGIQPSRIGLWSVGRDEFGRWSINLERVATNDNSETQIIAAAIIGDYVETVHTAEGTLTNSINGSASNTTYAATSVYESTVNPGISAQDRVAKKKLTAFAAHFEPLPSSATVALKYRVDSKGADGDWVTVATASTAGDDFIEMVDAAGTAFTDGRNFEFRLESVGGAVITAFSYKYEVMETNT